VLIDKRPGFQKNLTTTAFGFMIGSNMTFLILVKSTVQVDFLFAQKQLIDIEYPTGLLLFS
jgi:hypothetical protein